MTFDAVLEGLQQRKDRARRMGGAERVRRYHESGRLTARERVDRLLDDGSFVELGLLACSDMPGMEEDTPADGIITGYGLLDGRQVALVVNDFTVLASTNARVYTKKAHHLRTQSTEKGFPLIWLGESGGGRVPDIQGATGIVSLIPGDDRSVFSQYAHRRTTPWVTAVMGRCTGVPTWQVCLSDFVVQVRGSTLSVAGARALQKATGSTCTDEEMGGWEVQAQTTGIVDRVAEDEEDCFRIIKDFLSYLPSHNGELPPVKPVPQGSGGEMARILDILPEKRTRGYDMYKIIRAVVDGDSLFDVKPLFGRTVITCLARIGGRVVGCIASQPMVNGGAMDTDALEKMTGFMCLCDSFNIPLLFLHDTPGFLVGKEAELKKVGARVTNAMNALSQVTVPKISIVIRKSYGQAMFSMCGPSAGPDFCVAWPTAEISFVDPFIAADIAFGNVPEEERRLLTDRMVQDAQAYPAAQRYFLHDIIDPRDTRDYIEKMLNIVCSNSGGAFRGAHRLANWPTKF